MSSEEQDFRRASLRFLPSPQEIKAEPWRLMTTRGVAEKLRVDPAGIATWRYRGLFPAPEAQFFRGSVQVYRLDRVQTWLAQRHGQTYDQEQAWADALWRAICPMAGAVPDLVAEWVRMTGHRHWAPPGCRWRLSGFEMYLASLVSSR